MIADSFVVCYAYFRLLELRRPKADMWCMLTVVMMIVWLIVGIQCDQCKSEFFHLDSANPVGCDPCNCDPLKSTSTVCDADTGQCECKSNVGGRRCDHCISGWYGKGVECSRCDCYADGSLSTSSCNFTSGQCQCKAFVVGQNCDTCLDGYYGSVSLHTSHRHHHHHQHF